MNAPLAAPAVALAIGAHPDDIEFGCGATLARWSAAGAVVHHLVLTDGSKGSWDPTTDRDALVATRRREQSAAAAALGATGRQLFLEAVDGELGSGIELRGQVARVIRELQPDVVLGHDPWKRYRLHPDHRHAGLLTVEGVVAARDPHYHPEHGLAAHRPTTLLLFEADEADHWEPADEAAVAAKLAALFAHTSQLESTMGVVVGSPDEPAQREAFAQRVRHRLATSAAQASQAGVHVGDGLAEAFKLLDPAS